MLRSLQHSTTTHWSLLFICSPGDLDQQHECRRLSRVNANVNCHTVTWKSDRGDFALKTTYGIRMTSSPWIFFGADDLEFTPGWDIAALRVAQETGKRVIGTNDGANPSVKRGLHATHLLVARSYIKEYGVVDEENAFYSSSYDHQATDVEAVEWAKRNNEWAFAKDSVVLHKHPIWGTAPKDATYTKALRSGRADIELFNQRRKLWR